jgi:hypothetical protein
LLFHLGNNLMWLMVGCKAVRQAIIK